MRRSRRGRRRRPPTQWVVNTSGSWGQITLPAVGTLYSQTLLGTITPAGVSESNPPPIERLTVNRVMGNFNFSAFSSASSDVISVNAGIYVTQATGLSAGLLWDPGDGRDANKHWMWIRHWMLGIPQVGGGGTTNSATGNLKGTGNQVDIKTKRVLEPDEVMVLTYSWTAVSVVGTVGAYQQSFLRTLISRIA